MRQPEYDEPQESKGYADVGWILPKKPDGIFSYHGSIVLQYGLLMVDLDAVSKGLPYKTFKENVK